MAFRRGWPFRRPLEPGVMEQYKMPHLTAASRAGIAAFPKMIPGNDRHPNAAYISEIDSVLRTWDVPVLVMFSDRDIAFKPTEGQRIADMVPNGRFHVVRNAGHYLQEDAGEEIAQRMDHVPETRGQDYLTRDEVIPFKSKCPRRSYNSPRACRHPVWTGRRESYYRIRGPYSLRWLGAYSFALLGESRLE